MVLGDRWEWGVEAVVQGNWWGVEAVVLGDRWEWGVEAVVQGDQEGCGTHTYICRGDSLEGMVHTRGTCNYLGPTS